MSRTIVHVLHPEAVRALADSRAYERGERYFREGRVAAIHRQGSTLQADVDGSQRYQVKIWVRGDGLAYTCTCPMGSGEGMFCKHCVAATLAWIAQQASAAPDEDEAEPETETEKPTPDQESASTDESAMAATPLDTAPARPSRAIIVKPPAPMPPARRTLFLAGTIEMGRADKWQPRVADSLLDIDHLLILDPRRDQWDATWEQSIDHPQFRAQVEWELSGLERADVVAMYFAPDSKSPITLLELGLCATSGKLVVFCPPGFWRKGNVDIVCRRHGIHQVRDFDEFSAALRARVRAIRS